MQKLINLTITLMAAAVVLATPSAAADHEHDRMKVGKSASIRLARDTRLGDRMLPAGEYRVQHRANGADHYVVFTQINSRNRIEPVRIACELERLPSEASYTAVVTRDRGSLALLTRIQVSGENVAHVF